jgi:hypothetical protein
MRSIAACGKLPQSECAIIRAHAEALRLKKQGELTKTTRNSQSEKAKKA